MTLVDLEQAVPINHNTQTDMYYRKKSEQLDHI